MPATQQFKDENRLSEKKCNRVNKSLKVHCEEYKLRNVHVGKQQLVGIKDTLHQLLLKSIVVSQP